MKKIKLVLCILFATVCVAALAVFAACGNGGDSGSGDGAGIEQGGGNTDATLKDITGVTLADATYTYDGDVHSLAIAGTLPNGVSVTYQNNNKVDAGTYTVTSTLSGDGYKTLNLTATLTIEKATITGISFNGNTVTYDGQAHSLAIEGAIPDGVSVVYENNGKIEAGSYEIKAIISGKNYNTLELTAVLHILPNLSGIAESIIDSFGSTPDVWEFLPESFRLNENRAYTGSTTIDFTTAKQVSAIPVSGIGKQLDVVYGTVVNMQDLLGYTDIFYKSANTIATLYQEYINTHPENYKTFEGQTGGGAIVFKIQLIDSRYKLFAKIGPASLELTSNTNDNSYTGRIQLSNNALKFEVGENTLTIALNILNHAVRQLIFARADNVVTCNMYETLYFEESTFKETSALLTWDGATVSVCGANGDFFLGSSGEVVELYDAATGRYLGSKVKETVSSVEYNTYWFNLSSIGGINLVRVVAESHGNGLLAATSPCTVYLNGSSNYFTPMLVGGTGAKMRSRRCDIEMKKMYYYVYDGESFEKISIDIPMIFVQAEVYDTFAADIKNKNSNLTVTSNVPASTITMLDLYYEVGLEAYEEIAGLITPAEIVAYIGTKDKWFD